MDITKHRKAEFIFPETTKNFDQISIEFKVLKYYVTTSISYCFSGILFVLFGCPWSLPFTSKHFIRSTTLQRPILCILFKRGCRCFCWRPWKVCKLNLVKLTQKYKCITGTFLWWWLEPGDHQSWSTYSLCTIMLQLQGWIKPERSIRVLWWYYTGWLKSDASPSDQTRQWHTNWHSLYGVQHCEVIRMEWMGVEKESHQTGQ